jgi:hypothetical protein
VTTVTGREGTHRRRIALGGRNSGRYTPTSRARAP